ncbi:MAG: hypothetical protein Q4D65_09525 [Peptostreptococcaceae bacterium]|nr:hypothetical protein [Peptostreptococcaceae bacterium]
MRIWIAIFCVLTLIFASLGMMEIMSDDIATPIMFVFLGLFLLVIAKDRYDKGAKKDSVMFVGVAVFIYGLIAYYVISRFL